MAIVDVPRHLWTLTPLTVPSKDYSAQNFQRWCGEPKPTELKHCLLLGSTTAGRCGQF